VFTVFFDVAYQSYLPSLVARDQLVEGNSKLEITRSASQIGGPGLSGLLVQALTAPGAVLVDAVSFVGSALFLFRIRTVEEKPQRAGEGERGPGMKAELAEGLRWVLGNRLLRPIAASTATFNFFGNLMFAVLLVYLVRELGMSAGVIGLVMMLGNLGFLAGALTSSRISAKIGVGPAIVAGASLGVVQLLVPLAPQDATGAIPFLVIAFLVSGFGVVLYNVNQVSLRQAITPERLQGRMNSVMRFIVWGVIPLGTLAGGAIASTTTLRTSVWVGAVGICLAAVPVLLSPVRSLRTVPDPDEGHAGAGEVPLGPGPAPIPAVEGERP
jgi:predicted MFS family arabinose efflux permease